MPQGNTVSMRRATSVPRSWVNGGETSIGVRAAVGSQPNHVVILVFGGDMMKNLQTEKRVATVT